MQILNNFGKTLRIYFKIRTIRTARIKGLRIARIFQNLHLNVSL